MTDAEMLRELREKYTEWEGCGCEGWTKEDRLRERELADNLLAHMPMLISLAERAQELNDPIPMLLHCPTCDTQHIDRPDGEWTNPPHKSHLCHACGCIWRPCDRPTNGVAEIGTIGKADTWRLPDD